VEEGFIRTTSGNVTDYDHIREDIKTLGEVYHIREIAHDRWNATHLGTQLSGLGFDMVPFGLGFASMNDPSKELERLVIARELRHDGNPVMRWQASHVAVDQDPAGNIKISKKASAEKIDGFTALILGIGRSIVAEAEAGPSVYERRGALIL
jgi:phage terminase large subunit-like protein